MHLLRGVSLVDVVGGKSEADFLIEPSDPRGRGLPCRAIWAEYRHRIAAYLVTLRFSERCARAGASRLRASLSDPATVSTTGSARSDRQTPTAASRNALAGSRSLTTTSTRATGGQTRGHSRTPARGS